MVFAPLRPETNNIYLYIYGLASLWALFSLTRYVLIDTGFLPFSYDSHFYSNASFFLIFIGGLCFLYSRNLYRLWTSLTKVHIGIFVIFSLLLYFYFLIFGGGQEEIKYPYRYVQSLDTGTVYYAIKSLEILFQQLIISLLILGLYDQTKSFWKTVFFFLSLFFVAHIPLAILFPLKFVALFSFGALGAGVVFPYFILRVHGGVVYSYLVHWVFYLTAFTFLVPFLL